MMKNATAIATLAMLAVAVQAASAAIGVAPIDLPASTDTRISVPVIKNNVGEFAISAISGSDITLSGAGFTAGQFPLNSQGNALFYVRFIDGPLAGRWFNIDAQSGDTLTLSVEDTGGAAAGDLASANVGDNVVVIEHWTIESLFPVGLEGLTFDASPFFFQPNGVRVLLPDNTDVGINRPVNEALIYVNSSSDWRNLSNQARGDVVVGPQRTLIVRNPNPISTGQPDDPNTIRDESSGNRTLFAVGEVGEIDIVECVPTAAAQSDIIVAANNLFPTTISQIGLETVLNDSGFFFTPKDRILVFPTPTAGVGNNVPSSEAIIRVGGNYVNLSNTNRNDRPLSPGEVFIIRQNPAAAGLDKWQVSQ